MTFVGATLTPTNQAGNYTCIYCVEHNVKQKQIDELLFKT